ncbi:MAG: Na/Pi cotransporter family protein [Eubacteriaceae bacterium]|nr:Na/Pi cotransporter family protein [Eubacteriaceae bacterium]
MSVLDIIGMLGGMSMFLFGMSVMGDSLKKVAGSRLEGILQKLSGNTVKAVLLGAGVTAAIQSSSAASVMVVGFVNSGMMALKQALGVILGAILGTSVTGWILCLNSLGGSGASIARYFSTSTLTGVVALIGIALWMFSKSRVKKNVGGILLGFAVLMFGMSTMSGAVSSLKDDPAFIEALTRFSNPVLGILAGLLLTAVLQSASATVGILQALASTGMITFDVALPVIMGIGIGACVPVLLTAMGSSVNGKRTAFGYLFANLSGTVIVGGIFYILNAFIRFSFMSMVMSMVSVALVNTLYRLATVILLTPMLGLMDRLLCRIFPDDPSTMAEQADMERLSDSLLEYPSAAVVQATQVMKTVCEKACGSVENAVAARRTGDPQAIERVRELEALLDRYEDRLGSYMGRILGTDLGGILAERVNEYLHVLNRLETMSDVAGDVSDVVESMKDAKASFSPDADLELRKLEDAVLEIVRLTGKAFSEDDTQCSMRIEPLRDAIALMCSSMKDNHIERVARGRCTYQTGMYFNDLTGEYDRIAELCDKTIAEALERKQGTLGVHELRKSLRSPDDSEYTLLLEEYSKAYSVEPITE